MAPRAEMDLDCTDEEWAAFIKKVERMGEQEIERMLERQQAGKPPSAPAPQIDPSTLYYWTHLMGGEGDQ